MNGTQNWCTLVGVHPEEQAAVRESGCAASPRPVFSVSSSAPLVPRAEVADITWGWLRAAGCSPRSFFLSTFPWRAAGIRGGGGGVAGGRLFRDSGRTCPLGGHCDSCRGLRAGSQCALLRRPVGSRLGRGEMSSWDGISALFGLRVPDEGDSAFLWVLVPAEALQRTYWCFGW